MATDTIHVDALLDLSMDSIASGSDLRRMASVVGGGMVEGLQQGSRELNKQLKKDAPSIIALFRTGMNATGKELMQRGKDLAKLQKRVQQDIADANTQIMNATDEAEKTRIKARRDASAQLLKQEEKSHSDWVDREIKSAERRQEILDRADKRSKLSATELAQKIGGATTEGVSNIADTLSSGSIDPKELSGGLAKGMGGALDVVGGKMAQMGGSLGKAGMMLSTAAVGLTAAAGAITAIVGVFAAAYGQTKEMNNTLANSVGSLNAMSVSGKNLSGTLGDLRNVTFDLGSSLRVSHADAMTAMGSFTEAGMSLSNLTSFVRGNADAMTELTNVTESAILASKGLGIEVSDFAGFAEQFRKMGYGLNEVQGAFGMISYEARKAGVTTKSFFTAINEASSGMAMYNFRVGDTVGLFSDLVGILGEDLAKSKLGLEKSFGNMSFQDRYKQTLTTGTKTAKGIAVADAKAQAQEFGKQFAQIQGLGGVGGSGSIDVEKLGKLNEKGFQKLLVGIRGGSVEEQNLAKQQLSSLYNLSKATKGTTSAVAMSLGGLSRQGEIAMELASGQALLGGKSLAEAAESPVTRMLLEEQLGMSGEQLEQNIRIERGLRAEYEEMKAIAEAEGRTMDTFYNELASGTLSQTKTLEAAAMDEYTMLENVGRQQLIETQSIGVSIKNGIGGILEKIYGLLDYWVGKNDKTSALQDVRAYQKQIDQKNEALQASEERANALKTQITGEKDVNKRAQLMTKLEGEEKRKAKITTDTDVLQAKLDTRKSGGSRESANEAAFTAKTGKSTDQYIRSMGIEEKRRKGIVKSSAIVSGIDSSVVSGVIRDMVNKDLKTGGSVQESTKELAASQGGEIDVENEQVAISDNILKVLEDDYAAKEKQKEIDAKEEKKRVSREEKAQKTNQAILDQLKGQEMAELIKASGLNSDQISKIIKDKGQAKSQNVIAAEIRASTASDEQKRTGLAILGKTMNDFIYRGNGITGTINPIDKKDEFFGAKPGGAIDRAMGNGGIIINISGVGSSEEVARAVSSTLRKMGLGNTRTYSN